MAAATRSSFSFLQKIRAAQELLYRDCDDKNASGPPRAALRASDIDDYLYRLNRMASDLEYADLKDRRQLDETVGAADKSTNGHGFESRITAEHSVPEDDSIYSAAESTRHERNSQNSYNSMGSVCRIEVRSYGIECTWNLLRHVYISFDDGTATGRGRDRCETVEIHAGMSNYDQFEELKALGRCDDDGTDPPVFSAQELMFSTANYYGNGRCEGYILMCDSCATVELDRAHNKNKSFFLPFNNCDTIVPYVYQTPLIWFSIFGFCIGLALCTQTFNFFVLSMFVPMLVFIVTMALNRVLVDEQERKCCELRRCAHIPRTYRVHID